MNNTVGTLRNVDIKKVWPKEERDFTPWLSEHGLTLLLKQIGVDDVKEIKREVHCGDKCKSEADLVVKYLDGEDEKTIVIENQYNACDANHLGRLLMYSADRRASIVIWIAEEERSEYVRTVDWLNENCSTGVAFYLVKISLVSIGDSLPAPVFDVLAQPRDEGAQVEKNKDRSESMELCFSFWQSCLNDSDFIERIESCGLHQRRPTSDRWKDYTVGSSDIWLCASVATKGGWVKTSFTMKNGSKALTCLMNDEIMAKMESYIGVKPARGQTDTITYSTINFFRNDIDIAKGEVQQRAARTWFGEMLPKMKSFLELENIIGKGK